jgi:membrane-bound metal-dependent hydrolase YbcI (DUF457 family)
MLLFAHLGLTLAAARFARGADLAFVFLGSMLPDIIDKPLGLIVFGTPAMGRTHAHTILFLLILVAMAIYFRDIRLASLSGGVLAHLVLDSMWNSPVTLLWPFLGSFPLDIELNTIDYMQRLLLSLNNQEMLVPEVLGLLYLIYFASQSSSTIAIRLKKLGATQTSLAALAQIFFKGA